LAVLEDCHRGLACMRQLSPEIVYRTCKRLLLVGAGGAETAKPETEAPPRVRRRDRASRRSDPLAAALHAAGD
jgi:hypothetical protein